MQSEGLRQNMFVLLFSASMLAAIAILGIVDLRDRARLAITAAAIPRASHGCLDFCDACLRDQSP
jgi:hypothetical protein